METVSNFVDELPNVGFCYVNWDEWRLASMIDYHHHMSSMHIVHLASAHIRDISVPLAEPNRAKTTDPLNYSCQVKTRSHPAGSHHFFITRIRNSLCRERGSCPGHAPVSSGYTYMTAVATSPGSPCSHADQSRVPVLSREK